MKGERVFVADDDLHVRENLSDYINSEGSEHDLLVVGTAASVREVEGLLKGGFRPTVAIVDNNFPKNGDGERAAGIIRQFSPETVIVSFSSRDGLTWGNHNWSKADSLSVIVQKLVDLQH